MRKWSSTAILLGIGLGLTVSAVAQRLEETDPAVDAVERQLETGRHERLLARLAEDDAALSAFTTDGCSGGLSAGWDQLSAQFPEFAARHGAEPPWQACCIAHDRLYHVGGRGSPSAERSFDARKAADLELAACVVATGIERSAELRALYGLTESQVAGLYRSIAELMYRAVRLGGVPCTTLPWRWGYGWPLCR